MPLPITAETVQIVTIDELKEHLNIDSSSDDTELDLHRAAAEDHVQNLIGPVLHREVIETSTSRNGVVMLRAAPVLAVNDVTFSGVAVAGYSVDLFTGLVSGLPNGTVTVAFTAGRATCPDAVRLAALIIAGHLWQTQRGSSAPAGALPADAFDQGAPVGLGYLVPNRALELLTPYLIGPAVA